MVWKTNLFARKRPKISCDECRRRLPPSRRLVVETLEVRSLLAVGDAGIPLGGDGQSDTLLLRDDRFDVRQNDEALLLAVLSNDDFADVDAADRFITAVSYGSQGGTVEISEDGSEVLYAPPADFVGTETFTYFVGEASSTVTVDVAPVVAGDQYSTFTGGRPIVLRVMDNDPFWPDYGGRRVITGTSEPPLGGTVVIAADGRSIIYAPPEFGTGSDSFMYVVDDQYPAVVSMHIESPLTDDEYPLVVMNSASVRLDVLANDHRSTGDSDAPRLGRITHLRTAGLQGTAEIAAGGQSVEYTPAAGFDGAESFTYVVDNVHEATVTVWVNRPVRDDWFSAHAKTTRRFDVTRNDFFYHPTEWSNSPRDQIDVIDRVTSVGETAAGGRVEITADGQAIKYTPPDGFFGTDTFQYVADGKHTARVTVTVPQPVVNDWFTLDVNSTDALFNVAGNDVSQFWDYTSGNGVYDSADVIDGVTSVGESERGGLVTISADGQSIVYTPPHGFVGTDSFVYVADGAFEARVTVNVTTPVRDDSFEVRRDAAATSFGVLANDFYGNGYTGARLVTGVGETEAGGQAEIAPDGTGVIYTPPPGFVGSDRFSYIVDGELVATVHVSVTPRAILSPDWFPVCAGRSEVTLDVLANDPRLEAMLGETIITGVTDPGPGASVQIARDGRSLVFSSHGLGSPAQPLTYTVFGEFTSTVTVAIEHSVYAIWDMVVIDQNSPGQSIDVLRNDYFGSYGRCGEYQGPREVTWVSATERGGSVTISADGRSVFYSPPPDFTGRDSFSYQIDGGPQTTVTVAVIRRVRDDRYHVEAGSRDNRLPVLVNDLFGADYAGAGELSAVTTTRAGGHVTITSDHRAIIYTPPAGFEGLDSFTYTVDGRLKAEVTIQVGGGLSVSLPRFESADEFYDAIIGQRADQYYGGTFGYEWSYENWEYFWQDRPLAGDDWGHVYIAQDAYATRFDDAVTTATELGSSRVDRIHSETNTQIAGVDEADIIENDGTFLYVVSQGELLIAKAWPADELSLVSRLDVDGTPIGAYLNGDRLTIVSKTWADGSSVLQPNTKQLYSRISPCWFAGYDYSWGCHGGTAQTIVTIVDVSNRTALQVVRKTTIDGDYVESRRIGNFVYLVQQNSINFNPPYPRYTCETEPVADSSADDEQAEVQVSDPLDRRLTSITHCRYESRDEYMLRVITDLAGTLPNFSTVGPDGELLSNGVAVPPERIFHPTGVTSSRLVSVVSIDMNGDNPALASSTGLLASSASKIFGSLDNLYVFDYGYSEEDGTTTEILKFGWDSTDGSVALRAKGAVAGTMLNQFSADEYDGYLRIATTISNSWSGNWSGRSENTLFVLGEDSCVLEFVGSLQNLGISESIRSVRFLGDRAFVTTFRDIDPLFALDLSDPAEPRAAGHVTLPGYNSYMQFIDPYHILAVGRNASRGTMGTTQIALFDVTDLTRPQLIDRDTLPRFTASIAETDHHAFGWFAEHELLGLPTSRTVTRRVDSDGDGFRESWQTVREDELFLYRIDATAAAPSELGIQLVADLQHDSAVLRAAFIDQVLYSVAEHSITAVPVVDPTQRIAEIGFEPAGLPFDPPHVIFGTVRSDRAMSQQLPNPPDPEPAPVQTPTAIGPRVTDVRVTTRKRRIVAIEIQFDKELDAESAGNLAHFEAFAARPARRAAASEPTGLPFRSAIYDASTHTVTLTLARPLKLDRQITVLVKDTLTGRDGTSLADDGDSLPHTTIVLDSARRR